MTLLSRVEGSVAVFVNATRSTNVREEVKVEVVEGG
jgi:hypothetical protein